MRLSRILAISAKFKYTQKFKIVIFSKTPRKNEEIWRKRGRFEKFNPLDIFKFMTREILSTRKFIYVTQGKRHCTISYLQNNVNPFCVLCNPIQINGIVNGRIPRGGGCNPFLIVLHNRETDKGIGLFEREEGVMTSWFSVDITASTQCVIYENKGEFQKKVFENE